MKLMSNLISASILASSLATFNVPRAFADTKPMKPLNVKTLQDPQEVIKSAFAKFTVNMNQNEVQNSQLILRQEITEAAKSFSAAGVSQRDLVQYAISDMNPAEAKAFMAQIQLLEGADLDSSEGQEFFERILLSQSKGANFLPCGLGFTLALVGGTGAFIVGILAITKLSDVSKLDRQAIEKDKAAIQSEIQILIGEGVSQDSYLVTTRRAEIVQLDIEYRQMLDDKAANKKSATTLGMVAGGLAVTAIVGAIAEGECR